MNLGPQKVTLHRFPETCRITAVSESILGAIAPHPDLIRVAKRLIWWEPPEQALANGHRFLAQVMNLGTWTDIKRVEAVLGLEAFGSVLEDPPPGVFTLRRWNYWHVRLGKDPAPHLPKRFSP